MRRQKQVTTNGAEARVISYGLDVHKDRISVTVIDGISKPRRCHVNAQEILRYFTGQQREHAGCKLQVVYEAGFSGFSLQRKLTAMGVYTIVVNPADVPLTDKQRTQKNDRADSQRLASALHMGLLRAIWIPDEQTEGDRQFVRHRLHLSEDLRQYKHRIKGFLHRNGIAIPKEYDMSKWTKKFRIWLGEQVFDTPTMADAFASMLREYDHRDSVYRDYLRQITAMANTQRYAENMKLLQSTPGIGRLTAITILTEIGPIDRFATADRLASYIGLVPMQHQSGSTDREMPIQRRAQSNLRRMLVQCAWRGLIASEQLRAIYDRKRASKPAAKAIIVVARHQLNYAYAVLKQRRAFTAKVAASNDPSETITTSDHQQTSTAVSSTTAPSAMASPTVTAAPIPRVHKRVSSQTTHNDQQSLTTRKRPNAAQS